MNRILTLIWLKHRMWRHGLRTGAGAADAFAGIGLSILSAMLSLGLVVGLGAVIQLALVDGDAGSLRTGLLVISWLLASLAVAVPVFFGLERSGLPLDRLAVFPLSRGALYRLSLAASFASGVHLLWLPSLLATFFVAVVWYDVDPILWGLALAALGLCLMVWCNTLLLLVQRLTARRRARELLGITAFVLFLVVSVAPAVIQSSTAEAKGDRIAELKAAFSAAAQVAAVFPPSLAAEGLATGHFEGIVVAAGSFGWLTVWTIAGLAAGFRVFAKSLLEGGAPAPARSAAGTARGLPILDRLTWLPSSVRGVVAKEFHYLLRSSSGRLNIATVPVFMVVAKVLTQDVGELILGIEASRALFLGAMLYVSAFSSNHVNNAFAWERGGVRSYFMTPVALEHVILGKNLGAALYSGILALECVVVFVLLIGTPGPKTLAHGGLVFAAALLSATVVGNFISITFPVPRDISKVTSSPSQIGVVASLGMLLVNSALIGGSVGIASWIGAPWLLSVLLAALVAVATGTYTALLRPTGRLLASRRERLVEALQAG